MTNDKGFSDLDLARMMMNDLNGDSAPSASDPPGLIAMTVKSWLAHRVMEAHRYYGDAETWRSYRARVEGIMAAVSALLETPAPPAGSAGKGLPNSGAGQAPAADLDDSQQRYAGLTLDELNAIPAEHWGKFRERYGLGARPAGVLD